MGLFIATSNNDKIKEISAILNRYGIEYSFPNKGELPIVEENGKDLSENAILKAVSGYKYSQIPTIADDSGLEVDYLNGAPGVFSARFAGEGCSYEDNNRKLLKLLKGVPYERRTAHFRTVIAIAINEKEIKTVEGAVGGYILDKPRGYNGFGYDPLFYYPPLEKTFAELKPEEKNRISHRGKALIKLEQLLRTGDILK